MATIIAIVALILALSIQSEVNILKKENKKLRELVMQFTRQGPMNTEALPAKSPLSQVETHTARPVHKLPAKQNMENIFGKNVIGMIASILMFIAVFAFGTLVFTSLTDIIKVIGMFVLSGGIIAAGLFLTKKHQTMFSTIVTGCGIGMLYISIFLTHLYYHMIGDMAAFTLIFFWVAAVLYLSQEFKMSTLSYVALVGCIVSGVLSQGYGIPKQMFLEVTVYHLLTFILLLVANRNNKMLFKIAAYASIVLNVMLSVSIVACSITLNNYGWLALCFLLGIYNIAIGIMVYREAQGDIRVDTILSSAAYLLNMLCTALLPLTVWLKNEWMSLDNVNTILPIDMNAFYARSSLVFHISWFLMILLSHAAYHYLIPNRQKRNYIFLTAEMIWCVAVLPAPLMLPNGSYIGLLLILPITNLMLYKRNQDEKERNLLYWSGLAILITDAIYSLFFVFQFPMFGMLYSLILLVLSGWYMYEKYHYIMRFPFVQCALLNGHLLFTLANCIGNRECWNIALIIIVLLNMALALLAPPASRKTRVSDILVECTESLLAFILFWVVKFAAAEFATSSIILSALLIPFSLIHIKSVLVHKDAFMSVWYGIKFTFYTFGTLDLIAGFTEQQFIVSVVLMLLASICIAFGFRKELKALRIYGLALVISSVAKMVILDVWNHGSIVRVLSLICGALICFGISAVYTKIEERQLQ